MNSSPFSLLHYKSLVNCNVRMGGTGTGIQVVNPICVLSVNVYNEIVFVVLWFWLFFLALATAAHVLYLALLAAFPAVGIAVKSLGMDEESKVGIELNFKDPHDKDKARAREIAGQHQTTLEEAGSGLVVLHLPPQEE